MPLAELRRQPSVALVRSTRLASWARGSVRLAPKRVEVRQDVVEVERRFVRAQHRRQAYESRARELSLLPWRETERRWHLWQRAALRFRELLVNKLDEGRRCEVC